MDVDSAQIAIASLARCGFTVAPSELTRLHEHYVASEGRIVFIMSHSTTEDFHLGLLLFGCSRIPIKMVMNPGRFDVFFRTLGRKLGMIVVKKGISTTKTTIEQLSKMNVFGLLIGLDNTKIGPKKIHSGYFYIAQALKVNIVVLGFDYVTRSGYVSPMRWTPLAHETYDAFRERCEAEIITQIQYIYPLKPIRQVGFDVAMYRRLHRLPEDFKLKPSAPNQLLLAYLVAEQRAPQISYFYMIVTGVLMVLFVLLLIFIVLMIVKRKRRQQKEQVINT